jgi:putative flippase GtrA
MSNRLIGGEQVEMTDATRVEATNSFADKPMSATAVARATYVPTGVATLDSLLATADAITHGKAGMLQRAVSYLMVGGFAAVVNLVCMYLLYDRVPVPAAWRAAVPSAAYDTVHYTIAYLIAAEISIFANFIPNDRITFSHLAGHARSWWVRCGRFHSTCVGGLIVTYAVSYSLHTWAGFPALGAQAVGIWIGLIFNFTFHHLWTYRSHSPSPAA